MGSLLEAPLSWIYIFVTVETQVHQVIDNEARYDLPCGCLAYPQSNRLVPVTIEACMTSCAQYIASILADRPLAAEDRTLKTQRGSINPSRL